MAGNTITPLIYSNRAVQEAAGKMLYTLIDSKFPDLLTDWKMLKPVEKWNVFTKLLPFILPKQSSVTLNDNRASAQALVDQLISHAQDAEVGLFGGGPAELEDKANETEESKVTENNLIELINQR